MTVTLTNDTAQSMKGIARAASPWRRLVAYLVDYVVFIVPLLGMLSLVAWALLLLEIDLMTDSPWLNHGRMLLLLTLPIVLYFALCESSQFQATIGKRLTSVAVVDITGKRASLGQTVMRTIVKFLPWEFFHAIYWHWEGWPLNPAQPTTVQFVGLTAGWLVIGWFVLSLFIASRRTPYDRVAGTIVVPAILE